VITQGSVVLTGGYSTTFDSSCVPAHPAMSGKKKIGTMLSFRMRFITRGLSRRVAIAPGSIEGNTVASG
jgi:hypothetical protein